MNTVNRDSHRLPNEHTPNSATAFIAVKLGGWGTSRLAIPKKINPRIAKIREVYMSIY